MDIKLLIMWKKIVDKLFCTHHWGSHAKNLYSTQLNNGGREEKTLEILICDKCGKIKQIMY